MTTTLQTLHYTKEGLSMPIATMTDQHLVATIKLKCSQIKNLRKADTSTIPNHLKVFVKETAMTEEQLEKEMLKETDRLLPYLFFCNSSSIN
jgi:hypothetical protein